MPLIAIVFIVLAIWLLGSVAGWAIAGLLNERFPIRHDPARTAHRRSRLEAGSPLVIQD